MQNHLPDQQREFYEQQLAQHYGEPVIPVSRACRSIYQWLDCITENHLENDKDPGLQLIAKTWNEYTLKATIILAAQKSALLGRLLYTGGKVRNTKCPTHKGHWYGVGGDCACIDECGNNTGWLPNA